MATVPANPTLLQAGGVFGAGAGITLSALRRGAGWVPDIAANAGVPTGFPINLSQLAGATNYVAIGVSITGDTSGYQFRAEPGAPSAVNVTAGPVSVNISGGNPGPSVTWAHMSGNTQISTPPAGALTPSFGASVPKNTTYSAVKRCTVNDGVTSAFAERTVTCHYEASV